MPPTGDWDMTKTDLLDEDTQVRTAAHDAEAGEPEDVRIYYRGAQLAPQFFLVFGAATSIPIEDRVRVGRNFLNEAVVFGDPHISRRHAEVGVSDDGFYLFDFGSRNGTYLNGRPIPQRKAVPIRIGDQIAFGASVEATVAPALAE